MVVQVLRPLCAGPVCHHGSSMTCGSRASHDTESIWTYLGRAVIDKGACVCMYMSWLVIACYQVGCDPWFSVPL